MQVELEEDKVEGQGPSSRRTRFPPVVWLRRSGVGRDRKSTSGSMSRTWMKLPVRRRTGEPLQPGSRFFPTAAAPWIDVLATDEMLAHDGEDADADNHAGPAPGTPAG